ncbi:pleckstrin homology domain-containing family G member 3 isoform X2 [Dromiciops gliroides]|uniref:pleckstrin homology domain-containing family G member 3 isoform X2 n=1 Tax=Dromiciops gliroides TaxID=33562 RepID=UPI001CC5F390|nr:pleckstrin homology domain-containing family G member 3 isoform X2 [Dromiciops gliroides]
MNIPKASSLSSNARMPVSVSLHQDATQERPVSLASTTSSSGSSRDSQAMEEPNGTGPVTEGESGSPRACHIPNNHNNSSSWLNLRGSLKGSPFSSRSPPGATHHKLSYLGRVVREIVETERMYVQDLRSIVEDYLLKIIDTPGLLKPEQVSALFGNIENIYALNSQLLKDLDSCNNDPVAVANCFVERSQEFDIYTQYCNNYPNSVAALTECMRDKHQAKFFRDRQEVLQHSLPLGSFLLKPVQRILKYHLLLQEIAKHFDEEEDGFEMVEDAIDTMTCVAWYINDMKRKHEHAVRLQEVQSLLINWKGPDLTTYGELVLEGTFRVHRVRNERTFFLFDKALFITKKRGDHFVYKGHIPCSSLMLIESTKDSLCFTVTHYKHSKQQYSIQAKSVEEKRAWTHHIKRLILENHHATIPQKAKEAILEMDSYYPNRYRYSPERMKKGWSSQDDVPTQVRQYRRQSEPTKQLLRQLNEKASRASGLKVRPVSGLEMGYRMEQGIGFQHAGSAGALLDFGQLPLTGEQQSEAEGTAQEEEEEEEEEEVVEEQALQKASLEDLTVSDGSKKGARAEPQGSEEEEEEEEEEESLVVAEQVADFASSLLAALHCWHYRANALLFSRGAMVKGHDEYEVAKGYKRPSGQSLTSPEKRMSFESVSSLPEAEPDTEPDARQGLFPATEGDSGEVMQSDTEPPCVLDQHHQEVLRSDQPVKMVDDAVAESTEDLKNLSSEEEEEVTVPEPESILPTSVLDQASIIAERFVSTISRRNSLALEDGKASGFLTPRLASRSSSVRSLDGIEKGPAIHCSTTDSLSPLLPLEADPDVGVASENSSILNRAMPPSPSCPGEPERFFSKKEDTLSTRDRLLLDKIKSYYEHAEHHDAGFSIRRRESLSYIPKGLVRNSVFRFNSLPRPEPKPVAPVGRKRLDGSRPASWTLFDLPGPGHAGSRDPPPITDAEFRPSSEIVKIWEGMESSEDICKNPAVRNKMESGLSQENGFDMHEPLFILEEHELGAISEEPVGTSLEGISLTDRAGPAQLARELKELVKELSGRDEELPSPLHPHIMQLSHMMDRDLTERVKNKVYQLARQYSLRIKSHKPTMPQRKKMDTEQEKTLTLPHLQEEIRELPCKGKMKPLLSLSNNERVMALEHGASKSTSAREKSPRRFYSPSGSKTTSPRGWTSNRSPLSPVDTETFHWPDVRELCSKYASHDEAVLAGRGQRQGPPVNRSLSVPENIMEPTPVGKMGRCCSLNTSTGRGAQEINQPQPHKDLFSLGSSQTPGQDVDEGLYLTADLTLENNRRVIVLEKGPPPLVGEEEQDSFVPIRSPTSQEKMSLKAAVERCKAYQESEEFRWQEEGARGPQQLVQGDTADMGQQGRVRNLREKFQTLNSNG